jgi:hypothetical protein
MEVPAPESLAFYEDVAPVGALGVYFAAKAANLPEAAA